MARRRAALRASAMRAAPCLALDGCVSRHIHRQVEDVLRGAEPGQYTIYRANEALDIPTQDFAGVCVSFQNEVSLAVAG